jgi:hypothetical protein
VVEVDVICGGGSGFEAHSLADDKRDGLSLGFSHNLSSGGPALCFVEHLVREFMHDGRKLFGLRLPRQNGDPSAIADAECGGYFFREV